MVKCNIFRTFYGFYLVVPIFCSNFAPQNENKRMQSNCKTIAKLLKTYETCKFFGKFSIKKI